MVFFAIGVRNLNFSSNSVYTLQTLIQFTKILNQIIEIWQNKTQLSLQLHYTFVRLKLFCSPFFLHASKFPLLNIDLVVPKIIGKGKTEKPTAATNIYRVPQKKPCKEAVTVV